VSIAGLGFDYRLVFTRDGVTILDAVADMQDVGASIPRNMTGQPGKEGEATAFLLNESAGVVIEQYDEVTAFCPNGLVKYGQVAAAPRELDGAILLQLDEAGLRHTVILQDPVTVRQPGGRTTVTWNDRAPIRGRLTHVSGDFAVEEDEPGATGDLVLTLPSTEIIAEGMRAWVKGHQDDDRTLPVIWQRRVAIRKVLPPTRSKDRRQSALVVDIDPEAT
jgi:head-tail adaptor